MSLENIRRALERHAPDIEFVSYSGPSDPDRELRPPNITDDPDVARALASLDTAWDTLPAPMQTRVIELLVEQVVYNDATGNAKVSIQATALRALAHELLHHRSDRSS